MKIRRNNFLWKRAFLEGAPAEAAAGGGGGGGAGGENHDEAAGGGAPAPEAGAGGAPAEDYKAKFEAAQAEAEKLRAFRDKSSQFVEFDETTGDVRPKAISPAPAGPTEAELEAAQQTEAIANRAAQINEQTRKAEQSVIDKFKTDPLFSINFQKAREAIDRLPVSQRSAKVWERAYNMARGESVNDLEKHIRSDERRKVMEEFERQDGVSLPSGGGDGTDGKREVDLGKIRLDPSQRRACAQMIEHGLIKDENEYKRNLVELGQVEA